MPSTTADAQKQAQEHEVPVDSGGHEHSVETGDDDGLDSDDEDPAASSKADGLSSPWPEFIHLPEDTDSE
jgi:hypothetical protein